MDAEESESESSLNRELEGRRMIIISRRHNKGMRQ